MTGDKRAVLADLYVRDILEMSDEEVIAELVKEGLDPAKVAEEMRADFERILARGRAASEDRLR